MSTERPTVLTKTLSRIIAYYRDAENVVVFVALMLLSLLPIVQIIVREVFHSGIQSSNDYIEHLVVWATFVGGMITSREGRHLALTIGFDALPKAIQRWVATFIYFVSATVAVTLAWSALSFVLLGFDPTRMVGFIPVRIAVIIMPIGYLVITIRFVINRNIENKDRWIPFLGMVLGTIIAVEPISNIYSLIGNVPDFFTSVTAFVARAITTLEWPAFVLLVAAALMGAPLFIALGGIGIIFFTVSGGTLEVIPNEAYSMLLSPSIPAIPLFTLAGFVLSESNAGKRLVALFRSLFGWLPGGLAIAAVIVCAFFTTFTGASGVTILALGALLSFVLIQRGQRKQFTNGLLTASGSIGLLFPPSLPIILYGVTAQISIKNMFLGGILPGVVMVVVLSLTGVFAAIRDKIKPIPFSGKDALVSIGKAFGEILLPVVIIAFYFLGITTLFEASAVAVVYCIVLEVFIHRDIKPRDLLRVVMKAVPVIGGVFIILTVARGLSYYIVDANVPVTMAAWVKAHIGSRYVFLILLNFGLLLTGCIMDIYSAIVVVVPLIIPLGNLFGINPVHLGIIFLANLELGYLTPPVGLNLFLASYRFNEPLGKVYRNVLPFFLISLVAVLLITYVPWLSTALVPPS